MTIIGTVILISAAVLIVLSVYVIVIYNSLIRQDYIAKSAWSDIDVQLKRRADLIPALVDAVKGYAGYEKQTLEDVTRVRGEALSRKGIAEKGRAETELSHGFKKLVAIAEDYPDLKASQVFLDFQKGLIETEDQLQYARRYYNGAVRDFNFRVQSFPSNLVAGFFRYRPREFFEIELATEREAPEAKF